MATRRQWTSRLRKFGFVKVVSNREYSIYTRLNKMFNVVVEVWVWVDGVTHASHWQPTSSWILRTVTRPVIIRDIEDLEFCVAFEEERDAASVDRNYHEAFTLPYMRYVQCCELAGMVIGTPWYVVCDKLNDMEHEGGGNELKTIREDMEQQMRMVRAAKLTYMEKFS